MRSHVGVGNTLRTNPATHGADTTEKAKAESTFCACPRLPPPRGRAEWRHLAAPAHDVIVRRRQEEGLGGARGGRCGGRANGEFRWLGAVRAGAGGAGRQPVPGHLHCEQVRGLFLQRGAQAAGARRGLESQIPSRREGDARPREDLRCLPPPPRPGHVPAPPLKTRLRRAPRRLQRASRSLPGRRRTLRDASRGATGAWTRPPRCLGVGGRPRPGALGGRPSLPSGNRSGLSPGRTPSLLPLQAWRLPPSPADVEPALPALRGSRSYPL